MRVVVGRVGRAHGLRGEVTVEPRTDEPDVHFAAGSVLHTDPAAAGPLTVAAVRWHAGRPLLTFAGVGDRTAAEGLRGVLLEAERDPAERPDDPDEFYDHQLVGLSVHALPDRARVGEVTEVVHLPAQDLLAVRLDGGGEALVPFVSAIVPEVDLAARTLLVDPPGGLLSPADSGPQDAGEA